MSSVLMRYDRPNLPVAPERPATPSQPEPAAETTTLDASTTYDPHDRVPLADGEDEC